MSETTAASRQRFYMVDVGSKSVTRRRAVACGEIRLGPVAYPLVVEGRLPKGDALLMAEIAGLQGAKQASQLMPLCHPMLLDHVQISTRELPDRESVRVYCEVATQARTGVEMEALAGVSAALLTIYDLSKPIEPTLRIDAVSLLFKEGGKRGLWINPDGLDSHEIAQFSPRAPEGTEVKE